MSDAPRPPSPARSRRVGLVGHAGLARDRPAGAPDAARLRAAGGLGLDRLELDIAACAGGDLVLLHDLTVAGVAVEATPLEALRHRLPGLLTLDEALDAVGAAFPLLLDLKGEAVAEPLARRLRDLPPATAAALAVCTDDLSALLRLRHMAPGIARWRTLPEVGGGAGHRRRTAVAAIRRRGLVRRLPLLVREVGATGLCLDRLVVTPALVTAAHRLGLTVTAWTVNTPGWARHVAAAGVDLVTTDLPRLVGASLPDGGPVAS